MNRPSFSLWPRLAAATLLLGGAATAAVAAEGGLASPLERSLAAPSATVRYLLSPAGGSLAGPYGVQVLGTRIEPEVAAGLQSRPQVLDPDDAGASAAPAPEAACTGPVGPKYNLQPDSWAYPQNDASVDYFYAGGVSGADLIVTGATEYLDRMGGLSGYYVSRSGGCGADFEGPLPRIYSFLGNETLEGKGTKGIVADPRRGMVYAVDLRMSANRNAIGLLRTPVSNLLDTNLCPAGTHDITQAAACWPSGILVNDLPSSSYLVDMPQVTVDHRQSGTGASDIYVTMTQFHNGNSSVQLVACKADFSACSTPIAVSGLALHASSSSVAVRPDGRVTVTFLNHGFEPNGARFVDVKYVSCFPTGAPGAPECDPQRLVRHEVRPLDQARLAAQDFYVATWPKHDHRTDSNGTETYVVWDRCQVPLWRGVTCPRAELLLAASKDDGATWSLPAKVAATTADQFFPAVRTDRSTNTVGITYYSAESEASTFNHRVQVMLGRIATGSLTPDPVGTPLAVTSQKNDPASDPVLHGFNFGDQIGLAIRGSGAAGGSHAYMAYTFNEKPGKYDGVFAPQADNDVSRIDY